VLLHGRLPEKLPETKELPALQISTGYERKTSDKK